MYAENSDKTLLSVTPTISNSTGFAVQWDLEVEYVFPAAGYTTSSAAFTSIVDTSVVVSTPNTAPIGFTSTGILSLAVQKLDSIFNYQYKSAFALGNTFTTQVGFAISDLSL